MKKILFSCLLAFGIGVNAQLNYTQDFEGDPTNEGFSQFGGGSVSNAQFCSGSKSGALAYGGTVTQTGWMGDLLEVGDLVGQTNNGQNLNVSFNYKKAAGLTGTLYVMYAMFNESSNNWTINTVGTGVPLTSAAVTTCGSVSATIPAGTFDPAKTYGVGTWLVATGNSTGTLYVDDIKFLQDIVTTVPACATFTSPANGATVPSGTVGLTWNVVPTATNYKITVGTTPGASNTVNTTALGTSTILNVPLVPNTTYYAKIVASNDNGDATGCQEISFTTNSSVTHCGPLTSSAPAAIAPIRSVTFAGVTNTSDPTPAGIGTFPVHQNFTNIEFPVKNNVTSVPLAIIGSNNTTITNGWAVSVFIDWNNDGDFDDVSEAYWNTTATIKRVVGLPTTIPISGNITIPAGTTIGKKFMRIKYNFSGTTIHQALTTACENMINGQVEDYTLDYQDALAVSDVNKNSISVFPNPFTEVLKISDVKGIKSVSVNDISGRQVKSLAPSAELNLSSLKAGLYIVTLQMEDGSVKTFKAIKK